MPKNKSKFKLIITSELFNFVICIKPLEQFSLDGIIPVKLRIRGQLNVDKFSK